MPRCLTVSLVAALALGGAIGAQTRAITVQNLAPAPRDEWIRATVPFARGAVNGIPDLHVEGEPTVWQPFGAPWPDGTTRFAHCMFRAELGAVSETSFPLAAGSGPEVPAFEFALAPNDLRFVVTIDGKTTRTKPELVEVLETNAARHVALLRSRIGATGLVGEITLEIYSGQPHAYCGVSVFFSDPTTLDIERKFDSIEVQTDGVAFFIRHARPLGIEMQTTPTGSRVTLLQNAVLGDGQGLRRCGVIVPPLSGGEVDLPDHTLNAATICRPLAATSWVDTGAFGAFGYVPEPPPWLRSTRVSDRGLGGRLRAAFARRHQQFVTQSQRAAPDPFRVGPHGPAKSPSQTGDQADFGIVQLESVAGTGIPSFLFEVELSVMQEGCRPVHFFEADATPVSVADHPDWCVWDGRTHFDPEASPDRLGKPERIPKFQTHGWKGKRRSHWSSNYLCTYYLLTGCPQALLEIRNEGGLYLAGQTVDPRFITSHAGASRAVGRTLHTATWLYLCTGDPAVRERMVERVHKVAMPSWQGRVNGEDKVRPFRTYAPDARILGGKHAFWPLWMDTLGVIGPAAVFKITGDEVAKELADGLALTTLEHGWRVDPSGVVRVVYSHRWDGDGEPLVGEDRWDPEHVHLSSSIATWGMPSLSWGRRVAAERGLEDLATLADELMARMRAARRPPRDGWYRPFRPVGRGSIGRIPSAECALRSRRTGHRSDNCHVSPPVHFRGIVFGPSGFAAEGREWLAALDAAGLEPSLEGALLGTRDCELRAEQHALIERCSARPRRPGGVTFHHMLVPHFAPDPMAEFDLLCTLFETDSLPNGWAESIERAHRVLLRTDWNAETFVSGGVDPRRIVVVPPPFDAREFAPTVPRSAGDDGPFRWLSVFDWSLRKGHDLLFTAFGRAFARGEAELIIKTHASDRDLQTEAEKAIAADSSGPAPAVQVITDCIDDVPQLYREADGFVLPSRGEGWGRPVHEAMLMGLPVVATQATALRTMLIDDSVGYPLSARRVPVSAAAAVETPYFAGQHWFEVDVDAIERRMREVVANPSAAAERGQRARDHMLRMCDTERIAMRTRDVIQQMCATSPAR